MHRPGSDKTASGCRSARHLGEKAAGRGVVLATAADLLADQLASRLPFIDQVYASDGERNLKGAAKAELARTYPDGFIYAGDSRSRTSRCGRRPAALWWSTAASVMPRRRWGKTGPGIVRSHRPSGGRFDFVMKEISCR